MDTETTSVRLIIEENEHEIVWGKDVTEDMVLEVAHYIKDTLRKKYKTDTFHYRDNEHTHYELPDVIKFRVSPIYMSIPHRSDVKTFAKPDQRKSRAVYSFINTKLISIQKFEENKKVEQVEMKISTLKTINTSNVEKSFEDASLSDVLRDLKVEVKPFDNKKPNTVVLNNPIIFVQTNKGDQDPEVSPTFGGFDKDKLQAPQLEKEDLSVRKKVPIAGGDGISQAGFLKMSQDNKNPTGKKVEPKLYTLEDVAKHSTEQDAWIVINGKIYDVTKYLDFHPGGKPKLMLGVGKDGTALYNKYHPWVNANFLLEKFLVGFLKK